MKRAKQRIVIFGDIHFPFHHEKALKEALYIAKQFKPTHVVQIGDLYDQYAFSRFSKKNLELPEEELKRGRVASVEFWDSISSSCGGKTKRLQILGNHDIRMFKRAQERLPEVQDLIKEKTEELYTFKGVTTVFDDREVTQIGDVAFHHGYLSKLGDHAKYFGKSTVVGHSHTGGVVYQQYEGKVIYELNAGYLADQTAEPLKYRPTSTSKWTLGLGTIDELGPRFIPL